MTPAILRSPSVTTKVVMENRSIISTALAARSSGAIDFGFREANSPAVILAKSLPCWIHRLKSPSVMMPASLPLASVTVVIPSFFAVISKMAAVPGTDSGTLGVSAPACMRSLTRTSKRRPSVPPGWNCAKSSCLNPRFCKSATASASPIANVAVVLAVGASPIGQASSETDTSSATSLFFAKVEVMRPVRETTGMPIRST